MNEAKCTAVQPALHIRTVASYFDAKKCLTITWRSTCRQSKRAAWRLPLTPKAALTRRSFFSNTHKKQWDEIMSRHSLTQRNVWKSLGYLGRPPDATGSGQPGHWLKMLQWRDIVFIKACTQKVRIFSNVHTKYQPLVIGIDGLIQRLDRY